MFQNVDGFLINKSNDYGNIKKLNYSKYKDLKKNEEMLDSLINITQNIFVIISAKLGYMPLFNW